MRLFSGFELPAALAQRLALACGGLDGARWIDPPDYHLTLRFMGDVDGPTARAIDEVLAGLRCTPLTIRLTEIAAFGGRKPHSIVALAERSAALLALQMDQERLMRRIGLAPETRLFTPHVTLARLNGAGARAAADWLGRRPLLLDAAFSPERFVLYSSRASRGGGPYVVEAAYPLAPDARARGWAEA